jgi:hypothetical protein
MEMPPDEGTNKRLEWALPDLLKKGILAGIGALFMTEEGARSILGELKLPKEVAQFVINQVGRTKEDLFNRISGEMRTFLESISLSDEISKILATTRLEINTTIRFVTEDDSLQPRASSVVKVKRKKTTKSRSKKKGSANK